MSPADPAAPIVELRGFTQHYAGSATAALRDVDLTVDRGEIFGVIGESGAGKTTLLNALTGAVTPTTGSVLVLGRSIGELDRSGLRALRRRIGVVFQGVHLLSNRSVVDNVALPLRLAERGAAAVGNRRRHRAAAAEMLDFVGLADHADRFPAQLSGGQRQRVGIARALVSRPELLLCDEPTSSLDATTTDEVLEVLLDARARLSTTVMVVTHDLEVVRSICDRAALFENGALRDVLTVKTRGVDDGRSYLDRAREALGG